ncbi:ABC transporter permease [Treponema primitia]|uniref:ABC transporter permease n=1 Tax=Treponema primitia TaxID=88058 RepID=UPI003980FA96
MHFIASTKNIFKEYLVLVMLILLIVITMIAEPKFFTLANLTNIMRQFGPLSLVALGMTFVVFAGFIDLSIPGMFSLVTVVTVSLIDPIGQMPALLVGLALGIAMGLLNSFMVLSCGALTLAEALFITFGLSTLYGALALIVTGGTTPHMSWLKTDISLYQAIGKGSAGPISISFLIFLACLLILYIFQSRTRMGRAVMLTGGNKEAAFLAGVSVKGSVAFIFTISGLMTALAAIVLFSRVTTASPVSGFNYETNALLAVVVGGTPIKGGRGSVLRTVLGVFLVTLMSNCLNLLGASPYMQVILKGLILVLAIWLDNRKETELGGKN